MPGYHLKVPAITVGNENWFSLGSFGKKHLIRAIDCSKPRDISEPSGHRLREIAVVGSVKWKPKEPVTLDITEVKPFRK